VWIRAKRLTKERQVRDGMTPCMEWTGALVKGYPRVYVGKIKRKDAWRDGHRYSLSRKIGRPLRSDEIAMHQCDNPICINPDHLEVGSHQDNMDEMKQRKRAASGERNAMTTLTIEQVERIRAAPSHISHTDLAERFQTSRHTIARIRKGTTWASD
jgi:hypothetical protein